MSTEPDAPASAPPAKRHDVVWVISSYFGEGFPYTVVNNIAEILFKELGASLQVIGLTSLFHLPWNLKFLWSPFLDSYETKRRWLIGVEVALTAVMIAVAALMGAESAIVVMAAAFMLMGVLSATHDIAIDGFYLEALDEAGQSQFVGYRAMAYKVASLVVRGAIPIVAGVAGWTMGLSLLALMMAALTVLHMVVLPRSEIRKKPLGELLQALVSFPVLIVGAGLTALLILQRQTGFLTARWEQLKAAIAQLPIVGSLSTGGWIATLLLLSLLLALPLRKWLSHQRGQREGERSAYSAAFVDFLDSPQVGRILAFVVLFRTGESFLMKMKWPFLNDEMGMTLTQYGWASGTLGVIASFSATLLGGWLISRHGLRRWIWPFVIAQNALNLLYVALASLGATANIGILAAVISLEHFGEGLGTAVFMVYLMRCCHPAHKAAHMAILTALMSLGFTIAGVFSGFLADWLGYRSYFAFSFLATIPSMLLIFVIPHLDRQPA